MTQLVKVPAWEVHSGMRVTPHPDQPCGTVVKVTAREGYVKTDPIDTTHATWIIFDLQEGGFFVVTDQDFMYVSI